MPRQLLRATGPGASDQWSFVGAPSSWEAVAYGSSDASYIFASTPGLVSDFSCGSGSLPLGGLFVGVTLHYRLRATAAASGASVGMTVVQGGTPHLVGAVNPTTTAWVDGEIRVRTSWGAPGSRPTIADVTNLGVMATILVPPSSGEVEVSQLWVDVELIDTPYYYDPFSGSLPDAIVGPRQWPTVFGTQPVSITGDNYLEIVDSSPVDFRAYARGFGVDIFKSSYVTEIEARVTVTSALAGPLNVALLAGYSEDVYAMTLVAAKSGATYYVGITSGDTINPSNWLASAAVDLGGRDTHFRFVVDRDPSPDTYGKVLVYVNYSATPLVWCFYATTEVPVIPSPALLLFGTGADTQSTLKYDYLSYKYYKKRGDTFRGWRDFEADTNAVVSDSNDADIVRHVLIDPPGVVAGQSSNVCVLDVVQDSVPCSVEQKRPLPAILPTTYKIDLDYKVLGPIGTDASLVVQRLSDLWYWDQGLSSWVSTPSAVTVPYVADRTRQSFITSLGVAAPDSILVTVKNTLLPTGAHQILVYKVFLAAE